MRRITIDGQPRTFREVGSRHTGWASLVIYDRGVPVREIEVPAWFMQTGGTIRTSGHSIRIARR